MDRADQHPGTHGVRHHDAKRWRVRPGEWVRLASVEPASADGAPGDRAATEATLPALHAEMAGLQDRLWAESRQSLLVVLQALDAGGKDGTIKHVFAGVNPQATVVKAFKVPTEAEQAHDFLWRVHAAVPAAGQIGIFNRSHYEDVLVARVEELVPVRVWRERFGLIRSFEKLLSHDGMTVVKIYLHISSEEQHRRLDERRLRPDKRWKLRAADLEVRQHWNEYLVAYEEAINATSTSVAPWYVVPADHKWYRNWAVSRILIETLNAMDPQYPDRTGPELS